MAKAWCIKAELLAPLQKMASEGFFDTLGDVSSAERHAMWLEGVHDPTLATQINTEFEAAMASNKKDARIKVLEKVFLAKTGKEKLPRTMLDKLNELDEMGALGDGTNPDGFYYDFVADTIGLSVTPEQVKVIREYHEKMEDLLQKSDDMGLVVDEYFDELSALHKYLNGLNPSPIFDVIVENTRRSAMLFNTNSPVVNFIGNSVQGGYMAVNRRVDGWKWKGESGDLLLAYYKKVNRIYFRTGWDLCRMVDMTQQAEIKGETPTHSEGPGYIRAYTRWMQDVVFGKLMNDTPFAALAWCDFVDINSVAMAKAEGKTGADIRTRARELVMEAMQVSPEINSPGWLLKQGGTDAALVATWNNSGKFAKAGQDVRRVADNFIPGSGTFVAPFVRTVANLVEFSLDAAGIGFGRGVYGIGHAAYLFRKGETGMANKMLRESWTHMINAGLGGLFAWIIAQLSDPEDFVGIWEFLDPKQKGLAAIKNAPPNTIRIGGTYVSLDFMGPFAPAVTGWMYVRKYSDGSFVDGVWQYGRGVFTQGVRVPGTTEFVDMINRSVKIAMQSDKNKIVPGLAGETIGSTIGSVIPSIIGQTARAFDPYQRDIPSDDIWAPLQSTIPGWRTELQPKVNEVTGDLKASEFFLSTFLFGRRATTAEDSPVVKEISRLAKEGFMPTVTNLEYQTDKVIALRDQMVAKEGKKAGLAKFTVALQEFGKDYHAKVLALMSGNNLSTKTSEERAKITKELQLATANLNAAMPKGKTLNEQKNLKAERAERLVKAKRAAAGGDYANLTDEEKMKAINSIRTECKDAMLDRYAFEDTGETEQSVSVPTVAPPVKSVPKKTGTKAPGWY